MYMYELIMDILEKKGPASIPSICQEMNKQHVFPSDKKKPVQLSQIKTAISRKKDLFKVEDNVVFIDPEKDVLLFKVDIGLSSGRSWTMKVDFVKNRFTLFEWNLDSIEKPINKVQPTRVIGNIDTFKKELYRIRLWEWKNDYQAEGIVLDGIYWSIKLVTKGKVYESEGLQCFPKEWKRLCQALSKLSGIEIN